MDETSSMELVCMGVNALVVDDNTINLMVSSEMLRHLGVDAEEAISGSAALEACARTKFDVIFMDHMMPDMDGIETTARLREQEGLNQNTPVIALTANAVAGMREFFLGNKMNDFVSKPVDMGEFERVLKMWAPGEKVQVRTAHPTTPKNEDLLDQHPNLQKIAALGFQVEPALRALGEDANVYMMVLDTLTKALPVKIAQVREYWRTENWKLLTIETHGLKGALANVGANELSLEARNLEFASREGKSMYVKEHLEPFLLSLQLLEGKLNEVLPARENPKVSEHPNEALPAEALRDKLTESLSLLENLENDSAHELLLEVLQYQTPEHLADLITQAAEAVDIFDYDTAGMHLQNALDELGV